MDECRLKSVQSDWLYKRVIGNTRKSSDLLEYKRTIVFEFAPFENIPKNWLHFDLIMDPKIDIVYNMILLNWDNRDRFDYTLDYIVNNLPFLKKLQQINLGIPLKILHSF